MSDRTHSQKRIEQHLQLWIYLIPVVGVIPATWTLYRTRNQTIPLDSQQRERLRQEQKVSRLAINLSLMWLGSYALFSLGSANTSDLVSFRLLYANAVITTGYFVTCTWLMSRLGKKNLFSAERFN